MHDETRWRHEGVRVVVRSGQEAVVVNLELPEVEANPEEVHWVNDLLGVPRG